MPALFGRQRFLIGGKAFRQIFFALFRQARLGHEGDESVIGIVENIFFNNGFVIIRSDAGTKSFERILVAKRFSRPSAVEPCIHTANTVNKALRAAGKVSFPQEKFQAVESARKKGFVDALFYDAAKKFLYERQNFFLRLRFRTAYTDTPQRLQNAVLEIAGNFLAQAGIDKSFLSGAAEDCRKTYVKTLTARPSTGSRASSMT